MERLGGEGLLKEKSCSEKQDHDCKQHPSTHKFLSGGNPAWLQVDGQAVLVNFPLRQVQAPNEARAGHSWAGRRLWWEPTPTVDGLSCESGSPAKAFLEAIGVHSSATARKSFTFTLSTRLKGHWNNHKTSLLKGLDPKNPELHQYSVKLIDLGFDMNLLRICAKSWRSQLSGTSRASDKGPEALWTSPETYPGCVKRAERVLRQMTLVWQWPWNPQATSRFLSTLMTHAYPGSKAPLLTRLAQMR